MNDNIVHFPGSENDPAFDDVPVEDVLDGAKEKNLDIVMVLGLDKNGDFYFASSTADMFVMNFALDRFKRALLDY